MDFSFGDFHAEVGAINPAALPPNKRRLWTLRKMIMNLIIVAYIVGFCALFLLLFGKENVLIAATLATSILTMHKAVMGIKAPQAVVCIMFCYMLIAFGPLVGSIHWLVAVPVNFSCLYIIAVLTGQNVFQKTQYNFLAAYVFAESSQTTTVQGFWMRFLALMVGGAAAAVVYYVFHRKEKRQRTIVQVLKNTHLTSTRNRYAIRLALGLMVTMLIGDLFHLQYAAWMGMPVLSLSMPFYQDSRKRAIHRMIGTIFGGAIFLLLYSYLIPEFLHIWVLVALLYLYLFITDYRIQQMVIAIFSLNGASVFYGDGVAIEMRILLLLVGIAIVFAMNVLEYFDVMDRLDRRVHKSPGKRAK